MIPFNKPYLTGLETEYIKDAVASGKISGDGFFTKKCHQLLEEKFGFKKVLLTTSCTDALELAALLIGIEPGDEVIIPSYTFVSTANAFALRGAKIVFADSNADNPNIDTSLLESLITPRTKAIVPVHYAGIACDMDEIMRLADKYNLYVIEDAAQAIDSYYKGKPLGSIGHFGAFSFHETKNVIAGEGGMLSINDDKFINRAEIIREKGTNRSAFFRGEIDKYGWVEVGSSFLPSEVIAAFLYAQLQNLDAIQKRRREIWETYKQAFQPLADKQLVDIPFLPSYATNNGHMFYMVTKDIEQRSALIQHCKKDDIHPVFHYLSLHSSPYFTGKHDERTLTWSDTYSDRLVRLPFFFTLQPEEQQQVIEKILNFYSN